MATAVPDELWVRCAGWSVTCRQLTADDRSDALQNRVTKAENVRMLSCGAASKLALRTNDPELKASRAEFRDQAIDRLDRILAVRTRVHVVAVVDHDDVAR
jgi:hypothetical protein